MPPKRKQTAAALAALATRRSTRRLGASNKHALDPEPNNDKYGTSKPGKSQRSGTFSKAKALSIGNSHSPDVLEPPSNTPTRPHPRPRPRCPDPPAQPDELTLESTQHILALTQDPEVKVIMMSSVEDAKEADRDGEILIPDPACVPDLEL
jgi:hypothetical protein